MKTKSIAFVLFATVVGLVSCMREKADPDENMMTFYADAAETRTSLQGDGAILWSPKDEILIYHNDYHGRFASTNTTEAASVEFRGTLPDFVRDKDKYFYGVYPYSSETECLDGSFGIMLPSEQQAVEGSFSDDFFISIARTKDDKLHFQNVCGGVKFSVAEDGIKKVVFKANGGEAVAGKLNIVFDAMGRPALTSIDNGSSTVTLKAPEGETFEKGKWYYLVLAPRVLSRGYTIEFHTDEQVGKVISDTSVQVKRSIWGVLEGLEPENTDNEGSIEVSESSLEFVTVPGFSYSRSVEIVNSGQKPVTVHSIDFTGPFSSDLFTERTVDAGGRLTVKVSCNTDQIGVDTGVMTISYGASQTLTVPLSYTALSYGIEVDSDSFYPGFEFDSDCTLSKDNGYYELFEDFEYVSVGESRYSSILVKNNGSSDIRFMMFGDVEGFYLNKYGVIDAVISPGRKSDWEYCFTPTYKGEFSGTFIILVFDPEDPVSNHWCMPYHVKGISKDITALSLSTKKLEFSQILVGHETESKTIKVSNYGDHPTDVTVICPDGFSVSESQFHLDYEHYGAVCTKTLTVTFNPNHAGTYGGKLEFTGENLYYGPFEVELSGIGVGIQSGFVNFGTTVLWAGCNLGASSPTDFGDYYAWGETSPKSSYSLDNYSFYDVGTGNYTKYQSGSGKLERADDAASQVNSSWRIPSALEWDSLMGKTNLRQMTINGVRGVVLVGRASECQDQAIFLPFAGGFDGSSLDSQGVIGLYWTSDSSRFQAYRIWIGREKNYSSRGLAERYFGFSIRPVYDGVPVTDVYLEESSVDVMVGSLRQLQAHVLPSNASHVALTWSSSNESVAVVTASGHIKGISTGTAEVTVTSEDGGFMARCQVNVTPVSSPQMVDLGLSVKWASFNVGAYSPTETGDYYAWGETEPKDYYDWKNYKWCNGDRYSLTKYNQSSSYGYNGYTDLKIVLAPEDDLAHVRLGGNWRMPTREEWNEIKTQCSWVSGTKDGVAGYYVFRKDSDDVSIFIPCSGYLSESSLYEQRRYYLWSSSLSSTNNAYYYSRSSTYSDYRCYGMPVRAVSD